MKSVHECEVACIAKGTTMLAVGIPGTDKCQNGKPGQGGCHCWCYTDATPEGTCEMEDDAGLTLFRMKDFSE